MALKLGELLQEAGVRGAKPVATLGDLREIARPKLTTADNVSLRAVDTLSEYFDDLREIDDGRRFLLRLKEILELLQRAKKAGVVDRHVVFGLSQLAHQRRDACAGSKRSAFNNIVIPRLLEVKGKVEKGKTTGLCDLLIRNIDPPVR